jgi:diguanylate cyclase (GGDEF)-like protein/PAS domain S-box-containing protein
MTFLNLNQLQSVLHGLTDGVTVQSAQGKLLYVNSAAARLSGFSSPEEMLKASREQILSGFKVFDEEEQSIPFSELPGRITLQTGQPTERVLKFVVQATNEIRWARITANPIRNDQGEIEAVVNIFHDIGEQKQSEETIRYQTLHDALTRLPNQKLFTDRLIQSLKQANRRRESVAVLFLDLDRFKNINSSLGHGAGDEILKEAALRLRKNIREQDTIGRIGGDEFMILLSDIHSAKDAVKVARKILKSLSLSFEVGLKKLHLSTSIGIALYPADGEEAATLLRSADTALHWAKASGGNNYRLFNKSMAIEATQRLRLENELRLAIAENDLVVHFQPIVDPVSGVIDRVEALLRWQHQDMGLILPGEFIPAAEETGLIVHMAGTIIRSAGKQAVKWQKMGLGNFRIAINLSNRQFAQPNLVEKIGGYLKEARLDPKFIELEITESLAMKDIDLTIKKLSQLRDMGMTISVDDFGTGYSSLNYLKKLPVDSVKIDQSFITNCINLKQDAAIVKAIISMAHSLGLKAVAEGVETEEQKKFLTQLGCDLIQGFLISKPLSAAEFTKYLRKHHGQAMPLPKG